MVLSRCSVLYLVFVVQFKIVIFSADILEMVGSWSMRSRSR